MCGSGVKIGMEITLILTKLTQLVNNLVCSACFVVVPGTSYRGSFDLRTGAGTHPRSPGTTVGFGLWPPGLNKPWYFYTITLGIF